MTASIDKLATVTGTVKRNPDAVSGVVGPAAATGTTVPILPLMPTSPELAEQYDLKSPRQSFVTYCSDAPDLEIGDTLTVSGSDYTVKGIGPWAGSVSHYEIVLELVSGT